MTYTESQAIKKGIKTILLLIVLALAAYFSRYAIVPEIEKNVARAKELTELDSRIESEKTKLESAKNQIDLSGKVFVDLASNKDQYIQALGLLCDANRLNIHKMTVNNISEGSIGPGLNTMTVDLEVQGDLYHVRGLINDIFASEMLCRIDAISYRLSNESFSWMWRAIDDSSVVEWWNTAGIKNYLLEDPDDEVSEDDLDLLDASAFMKHGIALCYIQVEFIGTEV